MLCFIIVRLFAYSVMFCWCATYAPFFFKKSYSRFRICTMDVQFIIFMTGVMDTILLDTEECMDGNIARFDKMPVDKARNTPAEER